MFQEVSFESKLPAEKNRCRSNRNYLRKKIFVGHLIAGTSGSSILMLHASRNSKTVFLGQKTCLRPAREYGASQKFLN